MRLYDGLAKQMLNALASATTTDWSSAGGMGQTAVLDFYTNNANFTSGRNAASAISDGLFNASTRVAFSTSPISVTLGGNPTGVRCTASFAFTRSTGVVASAGNAAYFAVLNTNAASVYGSNVVFYGSVATTGADINVGSTAWSPGDEITITSLTFVQPN